MIAVRLLASSLAATVAFAVAGIVAAAVLGVQVFGMRVSGALGLYFIIWWTMLFAVLPFGVRSQVESGAVVEGTEPGAPAMPLLREKSIWTTLVALAVFVGTAAVLPLTGL